MLSIFKKEIYLFFSSLIGYIAIIFFLLTMGLFLWVFPDTNLLDFGYANLDSLFSMAPWVFMFLIPAITMRSFSEEIKSGTIELLSTKPLTDLQIIFGKYFASLVVVLFSLLPTLVYYFTISYLGNPPDNLDSGAVWGSFIGLLMLGAVFVSIGIFSSSITDNQIVAFIAGMFLCFFFYIAFDYLSKIGIFVGKMDEIIQLVGINAHYVSISRGVLDTRDAVYFITLIIAFILLTKTVLQSRKW